MKLSTYFRIFNTDSNDSRSTCKLNGMYNMNQHLHNEEYR